MEDRIIKATAKGGYIRIIAGQTTNLVQEGARIHDCTPTAASALGRMLTGAALMSTMLKSDKEVITLQIKGGGEAKGVTVTAYSDATVKGFIGNPYVNPPLNSVGKLDVGGAIGKNGSLTVIKDLGLKDPYVGQVPIHSGEIAEDLSYYFTVSEQTPSAVALGVLVDRDYSIKASGGFIIQMMPGADEFIADIITYRLEEIPQLTSMLSQGKSIEDIIKYIFEDMDLKINETIYPEYKCNCSRERMERAFLSIGEKDLTEIYEEGKEEELICHFCNTAYKFTNEEVGELLKQVKKDK
ncbi:MULTISPECIES: Hsp33 family molecular chaperone HslO [Clostridium]|uniref:33 kDa chaperonin n=1 Tax=Clostridium paridis TaxID=2803863 RepID=A0A937FBL6_9CLOT|nr:MULTISPECIES: Hsp33 family molecular chaperone HslO [Clostridium]MBL4931085.1 Hsp33 family molecular chaperone HslO [Clostridium paridis]